MFEAISSITLAHISGGRCGCGQGRGFNTGITGGIPGINNKVPRP